MKKIVALIILMLAVLGTSLVADEPEYSMFVPMVVQDWQFGYDPGNLICNPGAEQGEWCWTFRYPNTGNVVCDGNDDDYPVAFEGRCEFRFGCWHDMVETGMSEPFWMEALTVYELTLFWQVYSDDLSFEEIDTLDIYLVKPVGHHLFLRRLSNRLGDSINWFPYQVDLSMGVAGWHRLLFVAITNPENASGPEGTTCFYIDGISLRKWGDCQECVVCQTGDQPPETFCDQANGPDCEGCCPTGDDCEGLNPRCPVNPPTLPPSREIDRYAECY